MWLAASPSPSGRPSVMSRSRVKAGRPAEIGLDRPIPGLRWDARADRAGVAGDRVCRRDTATCPRLRCMLGGGDELRQEGGRWACGTALAALRLTGRDRNEPTPARLRLRIRL